MQSYANILIFPSHDRRPDELSEEVVVQTQEGRQVSSCQVLVSCVSFIFAPFPSSHELNLQIDHKSRVTIVCEHKDSCSDAWNKDQCSTLATSSWRSCSPAIELLAASKTKGWELAKLLRVNTDLWLCKTLMFHITDFLCVKLLATTLSSQPVYHATKG